MGAAGAVAPFAAAATEVPCLPRAEHLRRHRSREFVPVQPAGWLFMSVSLASVLTLVVWCYSRILRRPDPKDHE
jgi:hypothetical protein